MIGQNHFQSYFSQTLPFVNAKTDVPSAGRTFGVLPCPVAFRAIYGNSMRRPIQIWFSSLLVDVYPQ
jgi:hypothetical protein